MRHYGLWLDKYSRRRAQILNTWAGLSTNIAEFKARIPADDLFQEVVDAGDVTMRTAFVDGGEGIRELIGLGVYFIRASGLVLSDREEGELFVRDLDMNVIDYDDHVKERVELLREGMEFDVAIKCIEDHHPQMMFLDGSLYVKARRKPIKTPEYELYRKKIVRLLKLARREGVRLVGVSEDSKSRMLSKHLSAEYQVRFPKFMTDSSILRVLAGDTVYRTREFIPQSKFEADDRIEDSLVAGFPTAYIQPTKLSNPLRVDVPDWEKDLSEVLSVIASLSRGSRHFGYPLPLYLAHLDAHIASAQMDWTVRQIVNYLSKRDSILGGAVLKSTRRTNRPE
ncbi:MAG: hypothetical protein GF416_09015 [Candidatus Altiarchaeales archaeon]|nr:hypothetical protein [Candidatus Altiarchaeales archaeon]MBD3417258.1 hypothetical protein [Candidatus Altiarchaeales archaeon]